MRGNIELFGEDLPVSAGLIEHIDVVAVFKNVLDLAGGKQVFDVLRDAGGDATPFAESFPDFHRVCRCLFLFQKQMELVNIVARGLVRLAVDRNPVPHLILDDKHPDLLELLAKSLMSNATMRF